MLRWFNSEENLKHVPHRAEFERWMGQLSEDEVTSIFSHINELIDRGGNVQTSSFIPGGDWQDTPLQVIYERLTRRSHMQAGWCFGLMMMKAIIDRQDEQWLCIKPLEFDEKGILGTVYWRAEAKG
jgi:hypothetical protein